MGIAVPRRLSRPGGVPKASVALGGAMALAVLAYGGGAAAAALAYAVGHILGTGGLLNIPVLGPFLSTFSKCECRAEESPWRRPSILRNTAARSTLASFEAFINSTEGRLIISLVEEGGRARSYLGVHERACRIQRIAVMKALPPEVEVGWAMRILPQEGSLLMGLERIPEAEAMHIISRASLSVETALVLTPGSKEDKIAALRAELEELKQLKALVAQRRTSLFRLSVVLASPGSLSAALEAARSMGFRFSYLGRGRPCAYLKGEVLAHTPVISSSYAFGSGPPQHPNAPKWGTVEGEPLNLDLWSLPSHNLLVTGETGSGKTFFSKLLLLRLARRGRIRAVILDPLGDYSGLVRALGGRVLTLSEGWVPDPLSLGGTPEERASAAEILIASLSDAKPEEASAIRVAAREVIASGGGLPELEEKLEEKAPRVARVLERLLPGRSVSVPDADLVSFDLSRLPEGDMTLALTYLALELTRRARAGRTLVLVDEAWFLLSNRYSTRALSALARHVRHSEGSLLTITQSAEDLTTREAKAVVRNSYIQLHFRQRMSPETARILGVDEDRLSRLPSLPGGTKGTPSEALLLMGDYSMWVRIEAEREELELLEGS